MSATFDGRVRELAAASGCLAGGVMGVEKESLRVTPDGQLAASRHPESLGSALTNRYITTDFSEALLEFVSPVLPSTWEVLRFLCDIHQFTYDGIGDELLWVSSMPCGIPGDDDGIPLAMYGSSNVGQMKTVYRKGLGYRYGRAMQTIAGIHFNYSMSADFWPVFRDICGSTDADDDFRSKAYLGMIRNFRRHVWLVLYLFGASPALCRSFMQGRNPDMPTLDGETLYQPYATSLRMSDLGYSNSTQAAIRISLNDLDEYVDDLTRAIATPEPTFAKIGRIVDGEFRQLSVNQLQIENEYYSPIRPKRVANSGERPTTALQRGGIEYVEVRSLDLNPFDPVGISQNTMRFMEALLVYCLLEDSPPLGPDQIDETVHNQTLTAHSGRDPALGLMRDGAPIGLRDWAREVLEGVARVGELLNAACGGHYADVIDMQLKAVEDAGLTPSARILQDLEETGSGYFAYALEAARRHKAYFASLAPLTDARRRTFTEEAEDSLLRQRVVEEADEISFEAYLDRYFSA